MKKLKAVMPRNVGTTRATRVRKKRSISRSKKQTGGALVPARLPSKTDGLLQAYTTELVTAEWADLEAFDFLANRLVHDGMRDQEHRGFLVEDFLRLLIELRALALVRERQGLGQQLVELIVAPLGQVVAAGLSAGAARQDVQEVVRIAVVAGPAELAHHVLARLHALAVLAPLEGLPVGLDADLGEIRLHQLGDGLAVRVVGTLHRHVPQVGLEPVLHAGLAEELLGFGLIEGIVLHGLVVRPDRRRNEL